MADYTVMLYTCCGSNLDNAIEADINMVFFIDKDGNVTYNSYKKDDNFILK